LPALDGSASARSHSILETIRARISSPCLELTHSLGLGKDHLQLRCSHQISILNMAKTAHYVEVPWDGHLRPDPSSVDNDHREQRFGVSYTAYEDLIDFLVPIPRGGVSRDRLYSLGPCSNLTISILGLCVLAGLLLGGRVTATNFPYQGQAIDALFSMICVRGIVAASSPSRCNQFTHSWSVLEGSKHGPVGDKPSLSASKGHHPDCERFFSHTLRFRGRTYCAGCTGMMAGAIVSLVWAQAFFLGGWRFGTDVSIVLLAGLIFILLGPLQGFLHHESALMHFLANAVFAFGSFAVLVAGCQLFENFFVGLYTLALTAHLVFTRVVVSGARHRRICRSCGNDLCRINV
jgi:hypothetical protein